MNGNRKVDLGEILEESTIIEHEGRRYISIFDLEIISNFLVDVECTNTNEVLKQIVERLKN